MVFQNSSAGFKHLMNKSVQNQDDFFWAGILVGKSCLILNLCELGDTTPRVFPWDSAFIAVG